jgi:D-methionine transport system ATP-binding protein
MPGEALVQLDTVSKSFKLAGGRSMAALDEVSLAVEAGRIVGVIGPSGAGKSTLIRCVNLLERPDAGRVRVAGQELTALSPDGLRLARRGIGMIFQHFNLLSSRSVAGNVALALEIAGVPPGERAARIAELLQLVGLTDKADVYPARLSGGQKQRVGIARALATRPRLLLCDEATSALDPETTADILDLLRSLRDRLNLTVLLITHEMAVVKMVCDEVAVLEGGRIVEQGRVFDVFTRPRTALARRFVGEVIGDAIPPGTIARLPAAEAGETRRIMRVLFAGPYSTQAVISEASRQFGVDLNILSGRIDAIGGEPFGLMALACYGVPEMVERSVGWMRELGLSVEEVP